MYACVCACLAARGLTCHTKREQRAQRARRRALPHTLPRPGCGRCSRRRAEVAAAAERLKRFPSRLAECNSQVAQLGTQPLLLYARAAHSHGSPLRAALAIFFGKATGNAAQCEMAI